MNHQKDTPTKSNPLSVMLSLFGYSIPIITILASDRVSTIWGFYNTKSRTYSAPVNATKCGDQVDIKNTRSFTAMQLNLNPLMAAFQ